MKKLLMSLMVVGVLVSTPSLCGATWSLGKVTVDKLEAMQDGGLDKDENKKHGILGVRIIKDIFDQNEVHTKSHIDVSNHDSASKLCPGQCKYLGLDWNGLNFKINKYSHCGCSNNADRVAEGTYIDYEAGRFYEVRLKGDGIILYSLFSNTDESCKKACAFVGKNKWKAGDNKPPEHGKNCRCVTN